MSSFHTKPTQHSSHCLQDEVKTTLENKSHFLVVIMGAVIGAIFALFIDYHLEATLWYYIFTSTLPFVIAYLLRKVYIYTLSNSDFY